MGERSFLDEQYRRMDGDEASALDHPLYRYLLPYARTRVQVACEMLTHRSWGRVLDLGCGSGAMIGGLGSHFDSYTGLDLSAYQLSRVPPALRDDPRVALHEADLDLPLPFGDGDFDLCVSLSTIEYVRDPVAFLREAVRVLAPGGTLLLHTMNLAFLPRRLQLLSGRLPTYNAAPGWQGGILHQFTVSTLRRLLEDLGFRIEELRCAGLLPALRLWWPNALSSDMLFRAIRREPAQPAES